MAGTTADSICSSCNRSGCCCSNQHHCQKYNSCWLFLALLLAVNVYLLVGAAIFTAVEGPYERLQLLEMQKNRVNAINNFKELLMNLSSNLTEEEVDNATRTIIHLGGIASQNLPSNHLLWDYWSAVFFASTVITTIGYGTLAPSTAAGQVIFMLYATLGIPLALIFLNHTGSIIIKATHTLLKPVKRRYGTHTCRVIGTVLLFLITLFAFILIPGVVFSKIETWNFRESVYFAIVSLTTVGLGDFVPAQAGSQSTSFRTYLYKVLSAGWLWFGLSLVWAILSEVQKLFATVAAAGLNMTCHTHTCCCRRPSMETAVGWQGSEDENDGSRDSINSKQKKDMGEKVEETAPVYLPEDEYNSQQSLLKC